MGLFVECLKFKIMKLKLCIVVVIGMIFTTKVFSQNIPSYVPKSGLVGWWPFNGNANDESGNGNNGTNSGAMLTKDRYGKINSAYSFNGLNNYIVTPRKNLTNFSLSIWCNTNQLDQYTSLVDAYQENWEVYLKNFSPTFTAWISAPGNYNENVSETSIKKNEWNHLVFTYSTSETKIYLNNSLISIFKNINITNSTNGNFYFGASISGNEQYFNGVLDDIAIYNRVLTSEEVNQLYGGCIKEIANLNPIVSPIYKNSNSLLLSAQPTGGVFKGNGINSNSFNPSIAKLGTNKINYLFTNSSGCNDSTIFSLIVSDTLGQTCTKTIYDTITTHQTVTDTLKIKVGLTTGLFANQQHLIQMYPNPTASDLLIDFGNQEKLKGYNLIISDLGGKQVYKEDIQNQKSTIKLSSLGAKGIYVVNILDGNSKVLVIKQIILE